MSGLRSRAQVLWAEWGPAYRRGRLDFGPVVIRVQTRKQIQREVWDQMLLGIKFEQRAPGAIAAQVAELEGERQPTVHRLHAV